MKANYHTHLVYCNHATGHAEDYIEEALKQGFRELGITDHAPVLECMMTQEEYLHCWCHQPMKLDVVYRKYLPEIRTAQKKYSSEIKIYTGFEVEYLPEFEFYVRKLRKEGDYLNLGVHFYEMNGAISNSYYDVNPRTIEGYAKAAIAGMKSGLFNTLVHPDLFMFEYKNREGKRQFDEACEKVSRKIIECAVECRIYLELNVNGLKNSQVYSDGTEWLYPDRHFWQIAAEYPDLKIIIGADAHDPKDLQNENTKKVEQFAKELGLKVEETMEIIH